MPPTQEGFYRIFARELAEGRLVARRLSDREDELGKARDVFMVSIHLDADPRQRSIHWAHVYFPLGASMQDSFRRIRNFSGSLESGDPPDEDALYDLIAAAPPCSIAVLAVFRPKDGGFDAVFHHNPMLPAPQAEAFMRMCIAQYASTFAGGSD